MMVRRTFLQASLGAALAAQERQPAAESRLTLQASDRRLGEAFRWARQQALAYVRTGDPVGDWYEAALPGRDAFCMRDVSHQAAGAHALGMAAQNFNMLRKFAASIAESRDWCGYWEIDRLDRPAPVDYKSDRDFWYNLPANFDVIDCCYRMYAWTADRRYLEDPRLVEFYDRSVSDYVRRWDRDGDGVMESPRSVGHRGIGSYDEEPENRYLTGADLLVLQHAGYLAYARLQELRGRAAAGRPYLEKASGLAELYRTKWWDAARGWHPAGLFEDGTFSQRAAVRRMEGEIPTATELRQMADAALGDIERHAVGIEMLSAVPEMLYRYDANESAYRVLLRLAAADVHRREYPELSFALIGAMVEGMMGVRPDARSRSVETLSRLSGADGWVELAGLPVFGNSITVRHVGTTWTRLTNASGPELKWRAAFAGDPEVLLIDGLPARQQSVKGYTAGGTLLSYVEVSVGPGQSVTVQSR